ncbi:hypothetical protein [Haloplanus pelagicus]|uniref:hypothetical protein n=1 Tax=Haloplanus pelagicus TaxID=2949995 RepID=UPI00203ADE4E|nr:hypothetical protein [Haloplanus sp. HW8-1]
MSNCKERFRDLTHTKDRILNEDVAALKRQSERARIERYNELKADEESFVFEFTADCPDFFTGAEEDRVRSEFRLARLLVAASFYDDGSLPAAMDGDFVDAELQAVVDFDRYKQFDALSEEQIATRVRRMEGEVYELVTEYTATQLTDLDELLDDPAVQRDVMERLLERYEERREKIRRGFFVYVENQGLVHTVETIEEAIRAVGSAEAERERVRSELEAGLEELYDRLEGDLQGEFRELEADLLELEATGAGEDLPTVAGRLDRCADRRGAATAELDARIDQVKGLQADLQDQVSNLESVREETKDAAREAVREEASALLEDELSDLHEQHERLEAEVGRLEREREQLATANERLEEKQADLEAAVAGVDDPDAGDDVVTTSMARLFEMDYLGRFDISMHETEVIHTPEGIREISEGYWEDRSERRTDHARLLDLLPDDEDPERYPHNRCARYEITDERYLGLSRDLELVVEAQVVSNLDAHTRNGFDAAPADVDRLLDVVNSVVYEAEREGYHYLLAVASPTGWSERSRRQVAGGDDGGGSRFSRRLSLCLVDLQTGDLYYDENDPVVADNAALFEPPVVAERVAACTEHVRDTYVDDVTTDSVTIDDVLEAGFDPHVVKRSFNELAAEGTGEQFYLDEFGLTLDLD